VARFPVWALVDERAHYAYVQEVAEQGRLPFLGRSLISPQVQALDDGTYPGPPRTDPRTRGLAGQSYEAFQPPLYYALAAPAFRLPVDHAGKVRVLRALDLGLLLVAAGLLWLLARRVLGDAGRVAVAAGYAVALTALMWPSVVVRTVTVSNAALELVLALAALVALWDAHARRDQRRLLLAGALVGLGLLTRLSLVWLVPVLVVVAAGFVRRRAARTAAGLTVALPVLVLVPWLASNLDRYGALTAGSVVREMQEPFLNPAGRDYGVDDLPGRHAVLLNGVLAEEWWVEFLSSAKRRARDLFAVLFLATPLILAAVRPFAGRARAAGFLVAPLLLAVGLMSAGLLLANWDFFYPRYLHAALPGFGLFAGAVVVRTLGTGRAAGAAALLSLGLAVLWLHLATVTPFTAP